MDGKDAVQAWRKWLESDEGKTCTGGTATGRYLENRLWRAFMAGVKAAEAAAEAAVEEPHA